MAEENSEVKIKSHFALTPEALEIIQRRAPNGHQRGAWISAALVDYDRILAGVPVTVESCGTLEGIGERLLAIEKGLVALRVL